ncbi:MAG: hypothetical protein EOP09_00385 [Proteobacteria bacterium]|nr:MAG: hypothetical protein EOP09_00385 [Pseudomonadota bacterium]
MKIYHQAGFRTLWNLESHTKDGTGDGIIWSPVNESLSTLNSVSPSVRSCSFLDPQLYLPHDSKGKLATYGYSPEEISPKWTTSDFESIKYESAEKCLMVQRSANFEYDVIPTRFEQNILTDHYRRATDDFVEPYIQLRSRQEIKPPLLLSVIARRIQIIDEQSRDELLNWITSHQEIAGVYIIFDSETSSKQIKDALYLEGVLRIISGLRLNGLEVHVGYCNTEAILYSVADPSSISIGSYENLRRFSIGRFETKDKAGGRGPNPRLYVPSLLQWIEYGYVGALDRLVPEWMQLRHNNPYEREMFTPTFKWHFSKPQLYKHYFSAFADQVRLLEKDIIIRTEQVSLWIDHALKWFNYIQSKNVLLDSDSDGSHLSHWRNALSLFRQ